MAHQRLWHRYIDTIHGHVISIVGSPAQCQLGHITGTDDHAGGLIGNIHEDLGTLSCLRVFIGHIMYAAVMPDIPEMNVNCFFNIYFS